MIARALEPGTAVVLKGNVRISLLSPPPEKRCLTAGAKEMQGPAKQFYQVRRQKVGFDRRAIWHRPQTPVFGVLELERRKSRPRNLPIPH